MQKPYRSILKRIVLWPLGIMLVLSSAVFVTAMLNYNQTRQREVENRLSVIGSGYTQMRAVMSQAEHVFARYFSTHAGYGVLKNVKEGEQNTNYFEAVVDSIRFLEPVKDGNEFVEGIFLCFPDIPSLNFRGITRKDLQDKISEKITTGDILCNQWCLLSVGEEEYIVYAMKQKNAFCGCWMHTDTALKAMGLDTSEDWNGELYIADRFGENSLKDEALHDTIAETGDEASSFRIDHNKYNNYIVKDNSHRLYMGLLIPEGSLFGQMPLMHRIVFLFAFLGLASTIALVLWLNTRISRPIFQIKDAMERYGNGDVEYRLEERNVKTADEFDLLGHSLNEMMDKVNELEYNLYETRLKEQETQLKYISQQIRPHFILNALNVIYTYKEDEFPLVKKMVMYLVNYFRYIVNLRVDFVELSQEFRHVENYLNIQKERTQNKIESFVEWEQSVGDALIPPLILQTFVENSIKYAVNDNKLYVIVRAQEEEGRVRIRVSDTGQGYRQETLDRINRFLETREDDGSLGVGIVNAVERMDILYHGEVLLRVGNAEGGGAYTEIILPLMRYTTQISD